MCYHHYLLLNVCMYIYYIYCSPITRQHASSRSLKLFLLHTNTPYYVRTYACCLCKKTKKKLCTRTTHTDNPDGYTRANESCSYAAFSLLKKKKMEGKVTGPLKKPLFRATLNLILPGAYMWDIV